MSRAGTSYLFAALSALAMAVAASCTVEESSDGTGDQSFGGTGGIGGAVGTAGTGGTGGMTTGGNAGSLAGAGGDTSAGSAGTGGLESEPQPEAGPDVQSGSRQIGQDCDGDADCLAGLMCATSASNTFFGGGPAHGICTVNCSDNAAICDTHPGTFCVDASITADLVQGWCLPTCTTGKKDENCWGRADLACTAIENAPSVCIPVCANDSDCSGRVCDKRQGVCVDQVGSENGALGTSCDPDQDKCEGQCLSVSDASGNKVNFCSQRCVWGNEASCGYDGSATNLSAGACQLGFLGNEDVGDEGFCAKFCDTAADCPVAGMACDPRTEDYYHHGICVPAQ